MFEEAGVAETSEGDSAEEELGGGSAGPDHKGAAGHVRSLASPLRETGSLCKDFEQRNDTIRFIF